MKIEFDQLEIEVLIKKNFILIKPPSIINLSNILTCISILFSIPGFQEKNDIWLFFEGPINILFSDSEKIKNVAEINFPKYAKCGKTAIVVNNAIQYNLAVLYADTGKNLPREIKVFRDLGSAKVWVTN